MSLTSYRAAPSRAKRRYLRPDKKRSEVAHRKRDIRGVRKRLLIDFIRFGSDLLSHTLGCSTIGATALNGRVRNGAGWFACAMTTKPKKVYQISKSSHLLCDVCSLTSKKPGFYWIKSSLSDN
jgi:hypothetical protein